MTTTPQDEPLVWESTSVYYRKFVSDATYRRFSPAVRKWYRPVCQDCTGPNADLVALVGRLARALRRNRPDDPLAAQALDYLQRKNLLQGPLRAAGDGE